MMLIYMMRVHIMHVRIMHVGRMQVYMMHVSLMHVFVMHVKNGDERTNERTDGRTDSWILGVGCVCTNAMGNFDGIKFVCIPDTGAMVKTKKGSRKRVSKVQGAPVSLTEDQQQVQFLVHKLKVDHYGHFWIQSNWLSLSELSGVRLRCCPIDFTQHKLQQRDQCDLLLRDFDKQVNYLSKLKIMNHSPEVKTVN